MPVWSTGERLWELCGYNCHSKITTPYLCNDASEVNRDLVAIFAHYYTHLSSGCMFESCWMYIFKRMLPVSLLCFEILYVGMALYQSEDDKSIKKLLERCNCLFTTTDRGPCNILPTRTEMASNRYDASMWTSYLYWDFPGLMLQLSRLMSQGLGPFPACCWINIPANLHLTSSTPTPKVPRWGMMIRQQSLNEHRQTPTHRLGCCECSQTKTTFHSAAGEGMQGDKAGQWQVAMSSAYVPSSQSWCSLRQYCQVDTQCSAITPLSVLPSRQHTHTINKAGMFSM